MRRARRAGFGLFAFGVGCVLTALIAWETIRRERAFATRIVLGTYGEKQRLRADIERLERSLDNSRADTQTQAAFLREGYRSKTGETL